MMQQKTYLPEDAGDGRHSSHLRKKKQLTQPSHWGRLLGACVPSRAFSFVLLSIITKTGGNWLNFCLFLHGGKLNCLAVLHFFQRQCRVADLVVSFFHSSESLFIMGNIFHKKLGLSPLMWKSRGKHKSALWRLWLRQLKMFVLQRLRCIIHELN